MKLVTSNDFIQILGRKPGLALFTVLRKQNLGVEHMTETTTINRGKSIPMSVSMFYFDIDKAIDLFTAHIDDIKLRTIDRKYTIWLRSWKLTIDRLNLIKKEL